MPPTDQEPRYQLVDSNGNVVGSLFGDGSGNVVIADETDTQTTFDADGITTPAFEAGDITIDSSVYYAATDSELDTVLSNASTGSMIILGRGAVFSDNRTFTDDYHFIGVSPSGNGPQLDATWTFNDSESKITGLRNRGSIILAGASSVINGSNAFTGSITVQADNSVIQGLVGGSVTFESGTASGLVDSSSSVSVTDNGSNTVGDIA